MRVEIVYSRWFACLNFSNFNRPWKNSKSTTLFGDLGTDQEKNSSVNPSLRQCRSPGNNPEDYSRRQSKVFTAKSMAKLLGQRSGTAFWTRQAQDVSRWAAVNAGLNRLASRLEENMLPLLRYWLNSRAQKVKCFVNITKAATSHWYLIFLSWEIDFRWLLPELLTDQSSAHS